MILFNPILRGGTHPPDLSKTSGIPLHSFPPVFCGGGKIQRKFQKRRCDINKVEGK